MRLSEQSALPWYRHAWPWLLMIGPLIVIFASAVTLYLAIVTDDGLVTEDYYKKGLAINQTLAMNEQAHKLGLEAGVALKLDQIHVRLSASAKDFVPPRKIWLSITHPTRAGLDQRQLLVYENDRYRGQFKLPAAGHWVLSLEDEAKTWRMMGNLVLPAAGEALLGARPPQVEVQR